MTILDQILAGMTVGVSFEQQTAFRDQFAMGFWLWFYEHEDLVVLTVRDPERVDKEIRLGDLRTILFEPIFGVAMQDGS